MPAKKYKELKVKDLAPNISLKSIRVKSTNDIKPCDSIIGQEKAIRAINLGLTVKSKGYNIFVTGLTGTGRTTTIKHLLRELDTGNSELEDVCYVNNFDDPDNPKVLVFNAGIGRQFKKDVEYVIQSLRKGVPKIYSSDDYKDKRNRIASDFSERQKNLLMSFEKKMTEAGFVMVQLQSGQMIRNDLQPVIDEEPASMDKLERLVKEGKFSKTQFEELERIYLRLRREMDQVAGESKKLALKMDEALEKMEFSVVAPLVEDKIDTLKKKYPDEKAVEYLNSVQEALSSDLDRFKAARPRRGEEEAPPFRQREPFEEFLVNLILDNSETEKTPVITEFSPNYRNLFGSTERVVDRFGYWRTDFSRIKGGSILSASGGYLIINALDLFTEPGVWKPLKQALLTGNLEITGYDPFYMMAGSSLKPEPIPIKLKVVLIGERWIYQQLWQNEEDFRKIFKVKSEFDYVMDLDRKSLKQYAAFIRKIVDNEELPPFDSSAIERIVSFGSRLAGRNDQVTTRFTNVADIIREAGFCAAHKNRRKVTGKDVEEAIRLRIERVNLIENKVQEMFEKNSILVDTSGAKAGQINGLAVYGNGEYSFGRPTRITVRTSVGRAGIVNIEREADLSGPIHNKGVQVLTGFLRGKFAKDKPIVMSASICFEQSYSGVDGDSASSTEIYAILSSLADVPIRQGTAVTGSVNQYGEIQPIGGVNQKIEGFFDVCKSKRLTGNQGVIIPIQNVAELNLKNEVIEAVKKGKFHIYPVSTIDEGIEILTGVRAGKLLRNGAYSRGSIFEKVRQKLDQLAQQFKTSSEDDRSKPPAMDKVKRLKRD